MTSLTKLCCTSLLTLCACLAVNISAFAQNTGSNALRDADNVISRNYTLDDLGFVDGITFDQLVGMKTLFFPVPDRDPVLGGTIHLEIRHGTTLATERFMQVLVSDQIVYSEKLPKEAGEADIRLTIAKSDIDQGFVKVELRYSGAYNEVSCFDERASGDYLAVKPTSHLRLFLNPERLSSPAQFAQFAPEQIRLTSLSRQNEVLLAALKAAMIFDAEAGRITYERPAHQPNDQIWQEGEISLMAKPLDAGSTAGHMYLQDSDGFPGLAIGGRDPQTSLQQLNTQWRALAQKPETGSNQATSPQIGNRLPLSQLETDLSPFMLARQQEILVPFQSSDLPAGLRATHIVLHVAAALDEAGAGATLSAIVNNSLLGSQDLPLGQPTQIRIPIPDGLLGRDNLLRLIFQRRAKNAECGTEAAAYPAQILPGSFIALAPSSEPITEFFQMRQAFSKGAQIVIDDSLKSDPAQLLRWAGAVADSLIPDRASLIMRESIAGIDDQAPFLIVAQSNPDDSGSRIDFSDTDLRLTNSAGDVLYDGTAIADLGIAHLITVNGNQGVWLKPGIGAGPRLSDNNRLVLDRGDLALIGPSGPLLSTSTLRAAPADIEYPSLVAWDEIWERYRPWLVSGIWLGITLVLLVLMRRYFRSQRF